MRTWGDRNAYLRDLFAEARRVGKETNAMRLKSRLPTLSPQKLQRIQARLDWKEVTIAAWRDCIFDLSCELRADDRVICQ